MNDNGFGNKKMVEIGMRLNVDRPGSLRINTDDQGYFVSFEDIEGNTYENLKSLIEANKLCLSWQYTNTTVDDVATGQIVYTRVGKDFISQKEWDNTKIYNKTDKSEEVKNNAKDAAGEWFETWSKKKLERWATKEGERGPHSWKEEWYKKVKALSKKKDALGNELESEESDGSMIEESNCEKWGKNTETGEEWFEKWGENHREGEKLKWCDKWQVDLKTGLKKGENWGQKYTEDYQIKEHWAEKWDDRHKKNNGVYEKRHEVF